MDDTVLEQLAMEARLRQRSARRRRQVAEQYVEHVVSSNHPACVFCLSVYLCVVRLFLKYTRRLIDQLINIMSIVQILTCRFVSF